MISFRNMIMGIFLLIVFVEIIGLTVCIVSDKHRPEIKEEQTTQEIINSTLANEKKESEESLLLEKRIETAFDKEHGQISDWSRPFIIVLDAGHGGYQDGASSPDGKYIEKDVNLKIAEFLKAELDQFENVCVYMTRNEDIDLSVEERVQIASDYNADILISLHNNAEGDIAQYTKGCTVLVPRGVYESQLSLISQELGCCILKELEHLGLTNRGLLCRVCQNGTKYPNDSLCDYYGINRIGLLKGMPSILIEHSFIDSEYDQFLSSNDMLKKLAQADADGIASYFNLKKNGKYYGKIETCQSMVMTVYSDYYKDNDYEVKQFFENSQHQE